MRAVSAVEAGIVWAPKPASPFEYHMVFDFPGYRGAVFADRKCYLFKGMLLRKHMKDNDAVI